LLPKKIFDLGGKLPEVRENERQPSKVVGNIF
jgi:hypothetical protein